MKKRKEQPSLFVWKMTALIACVLFLSTLWILADSLLSLTTREESYVIVIPNFCREAEDRIDAPDGIAFRSEYRYDSEVPRGIVIAQSPRAGARQKISSGRPVCEVTLFVSLGVPDED